MRILSFLLLVSIWIDLGDQTRSDVLKLIKESGAKTVGVAVYDEKSGSSLLINEHNIFHAASTMKLPVMMRIFELSEKKMLTMDNRIEVRNSFSSIVDGSTFSLAGWAPGQPDDGAGTDCIEKRNDGAGRWYDRHCTDSLRYLCERSL